MSDQSKPLVDRETFDRYVQHESDYTPTTDEVRDYIRAADRVTAHMFSAASADAVEAFDRWLVAHDAAVRAGVVVEEPGWEYDALLTSPGSAPVIHRRRKAGPWAPVEQEGADTDG